MDERSSFCLICSAIKNSSAGDGVEWESRGFSIACLFCGFLFLIRHFFQLPWKVACFVNCSMPDFDGY